MRQDEKILQGAIDMHVHTAPSLFERSLDDYELAEIIKKYSMKGFVIKDHDSMSCGRAYYINKLIPETLAIGSIVLNKSVGGLNPYVVQTAIHYGAKVIWMPTNHSKHHLNYFGISDYPQLSRLKKQMINEGLTILNDKSELLPQVKSIIDIIAENDVCLATGHLSYEEIVKLLDQSVKSGVKKFIVTHANWALCKIPPSKQIELIERGAYIEYVALSCVSPIFYEQSPKELASWIREVGSDRLILSSDLGQVASPLPPEGLRTLIAALLNEGIPERDLIKMLCENPRKILGLEV